MTPWRWIRQGSASYSYSYTADYPITALSLQFQHPPTAEAWTLDPPADSAGPQGDGLTYHLVQAGAVAQGEAKSWTLTYQKADSALTSETLAPSCGARLPQRPQAGPLRGGNPPSWSFWWPLWP